MADQAVQQMVAAQGASQYALTTQAVAQARYQVGAFTAWYDDVQVQALAARIAQALTAVQTTSAGVTDTYLTRILEHLSRKTLKPAGTVALGALRRGTTLSKAYERLGVNYRWLRTQDKTHEQAQHLVLKRATAMAATDVQLADRAQTARVYHLRRVTHYRRVIHPEESRGGSCGLCIAASDRLYGSTELLPIHTGCHCTTLPVYDGKDPGSALNAEDLNRLYAQAGSTRADDLKRVQWVIHQHGELGPILANKGDEWRGPADVAA